ncbi:MAG: nitroreductase family protein [Bacteroidales bacterium]|jgi:nitroreductase|nr:nitroreductase family protein [Bacteroidales bacterium]
MEKILEILKSRKSVRDFSDEAISDEILKKIFEATITAPSSFNCQSWNFIYANKHENPELFDKIICNLSEFNQSWAKASQTLIIAFANFKKLTDNDPRYAWYNTALAVENLIIAAQVFEISSHQMNGFYKDKIINNFNVPEYLEPISVIALGYAKTTGNLPLDIFKMETEIKSQKSIEMFFTNKEF